MTTVKAIDDLSGGLEKIGGVEGNLRVATMVWDTDTLSWVKQTKSVGGGGAAATGAAYIAPANFTTNFLTGTTADTNDAMVGVGSWSGWVSGAVDPAQYTGGSIQAVDSWAAYTLALRPLVNHLVLEVTPASYTITCNDVELVYVPAAMAYELLVDTGSYTQTGNTVYFSLSRSLLVSPSAYNLTGNTAHFFLTRALSVTSGNYFLSGIPVEMLYASAAPELIVTPGSYSLSGNTASIVVSRVIRTTPGAYAVGGIAPSLFVGKNLQVIPGSYTQTGQQVSLILSRALSVPSASYTYTGSNVALSIGKTFNITPGIYQITGQPVTLVKVGLVWPDPMFVLPGVFYGPTGTEYVGSYQEPIKIEITTNRLLLPLSKDTSVLL